MFIGIDIGGTNIRIVTCESLEDVVFRDEISFETPQDYIQGVTKIIEEINSLNIKITAIAIGLPGSINSDGILDGSTNLPDWIHKPLAKNLSGKFDCLIHVKNDAEMGALGEAYFSQPNQTGFFYITWGTGVGCAQIIWNKTEAVVSRPKNREPIYKLEHEIGGDNIKKRFGKPAQKLNESEWTEILTSLKETLPSLAENYNFEVFVIGGGISVQQKNRIQVALKNVRCPKSKITDLKGKSGLYGALVSLR